MNKIRLSAPDKLARQTFKFMDKRLAEMLFRYRARNYPETLTQEEQVHWVAFCNTRLTGREEGGGLSSEVFQARIKALRETHPEQGSLLDELSVYGLSLLS